MKLVFIIFLGVGLFISCEEAQVANINGNEEPLLVVEALITNENKRHEVKLSQTFSNLSDAPETVTNAIVALNDGTNTIILQQDASQSGVYLTDSLRAVIGKLYSLFIVHEGKEYFAVTAAAFGAPLEPLIVVENNDGMMEYLYEESDRPSMMEIQITWDELDDSNQIVTQEINAFFYTLNVIDVNQIFAPDKERIVFPKGARLIRKKYSLTPNHQEFLRSLLSEIDWRGGPFDVVPGNVQTNLNGGALGYFAVSMIQSDVTIIN